MIKKRVFLKFQPEIVDKPIICGLIRDHDVLVNILQARVTPEKAGTLLMQLEGEGPNVQGALDYLQQLGVHMVFVLRNLIWDERLCTHCGVCVSHCSPGALSVHPLTQLVSLDAESCLACEHCIAACPYGALNSVAERIAEED
jgi:ferredoxin